MKILIVDDSSDNREMLERLITQYSRKYESQVEVFHAQNGQEAIYQCTLNPIDLIFMDIMMPVMGGLEATSIIKKEHPSAMIIVVSSENDEEVKTEILQAGAEDYVLKPFSSAIMLKRLNNYKKLIGSRNSIGFQTRALNTFTRNVYSYQMKFFVGNDDQLAQFWETMLVRMEFQHYINDISDFVRFFYRLATFQLQKGYSCHIYLEEDEHYFYFSMDNMKLLNTETVHKMVEKYGTSARYGLEEDLISFALPRRENEISPMQTEETLETAVHSMPVMQESKPLAPEIIKESLQTYDILDHDSIAEFEHLLSKLQTEISLMGSSSLEIDDIDTMNEYIKQLAAILNVSRDAAVIADSLSIFSNLLEEYSEPFLAMSKDLSHMVSAFVNDIAMWEEMIFYKGAPSVDFLDSSISSNVQMIRALFIQDEPEEEELDDIFDF